MVDFPTVLIDYNGGTTPVYYGTAVPGSSQSAAVWSIMKNTYDANNNLTSSLWAGGASGAVNIWANRASLSYS